MVGDGGEDGCLVAVCCVCVVDCVTVGYLISVVLKVPGALVVAREVGRGGTVAIVCTVPVWEGVVVEEVALVVARLEMVLVVAGFVVVIEGAIGAVEDALLVDEDGTVLVKVVVL